jgi:UDP-galactopyranose mutase
VVGCGLSGATLARKIAEELGEKVTIVDVRNHVAGNCYDYRHESGVMVHKYGPHIFHTNSKKVWDFVSRFTKWRPYQHKVQGFIDGQFIPIPFNLNSLHKVFPRFMADEIEFRLVKRLGFGKRVPILELLKIGDKNLEFCANYVYQKVFQEYTMKQWGVALEEIDPAVIGRVPACIITRDDRYFQDKYQGVPMDGYAQLIQKMLDHPNITLNLSTRFSRDTKNIVCKRLFYTGSIDEFFNYKLGKLPYRSTRFEFLELPYPKFQDVAVVNYPNNYDFTRITEYKWFLNDQSGNTVISYEYPEPFVSEKNERCYPIVKKENLELYNRYLEMAEKLPNIYYFGRLGDYKYYNMDKAVERALEIFEEVKTRDKAAKEAKQSKIESICEKAESNVQISEKA